MQNTNINQAQIMQNPNIHQAQIMQNPNIHQAQIMQNPNIHQAQIMQNPNINQARMMQNPNIHQAQIMQNSNQRMQANAMQSFSGLNRAMQMNNGQYQTMDPRNQANIEKNQFMNMMRQRQHQNPYLVQQQNAQNILQHQNHQNVLLKMSRMSSNEWLQNYLGHLREIKKEAKIPKIGNGSLDLRSLMHVVVEKGGYDKVC
jgi:hypothetical protein